MKKFLIPLFIFFLFSSNSSFSQYNSFTKLEPEFINALISSIKQKYIQNQTNPLIVYKRLDILKKDIPSLTYAEVLLADGKVFATSSIKMGKLIPEKKEDEFFKKKLENRDQSKLLIHEYIIDDNNKIIEFSSPVFSEENKFMGIVRFAIKRILDRTY